MHSSIYIHNIISFASAFRFSTRFYTLKASTNPTSTKAMTQLSPLLLTRTHTTSRLCDMKCNDSQSVCFRLHLTVILHGVCECECVRVHKYESVEWGKQSLLLLSFDRKPLLPQPLLSSPSLLLVLPCGKSNASRCNCEWHSFAHIHRTNCGILLPPLSSALLRISVLIGYHALSLFYSSIQHTFWLISWVTASKK